MISKLFCLLALLSLQIQGREASIVPVVETIPGITVTFGEEGLLKCAYERKSFAVYWRFASDSSYGDLLVALDQYYQVGKRSGPGYDEGRYNMTNDFSLLIHDVTVKDEGRYICEVSDFETGVVFRNYTDVTVTVSTSAIAPAAIWTLVVLVVLVVLMLVVLISVLFWKKYKRRQNKNDDDPQTDDEACTPLQGVRGRRPSLDTKRTKILNYSPDRPTTMNEDTDHINLGVFGLAKAGKSSLINSLIFSLKGYYPSEADFEATKFRESDSTRPIEKIELTDHINLLNYKGMVEYDSTKLEEILNQIKGQSVEIHCPIFICDSRYTKEQREEFMKVLSDDVCRFFGRGIMVVIPDKGDLDDAHDSIKTKMADTIGIPENHVWIFNNYTLESHEEDVERSKTFLDFISHCLTVAKGNQQFRATQKENQPLQNIQKEKEQIPNV